MQNISLGKYHSFVKYHFDFVALRSVLKTIVLFIISVVLKVQFLGTMDHKSEGEAFPSLFGMNGSKGWPRALTT